MKTPLRILMLEDNPMDAELNLAVLESEGIRCDAMRVETRAAFLNAIGSDRFDLILSDYSLPSFDGFSALKIARVESPDAPFIFVSGTIGEELAIESLKNGATDYVLKHRLARLGPAVRRAITESEERFARQEAEKLQSEANSLFRSLFTEVTVGVAITDESGRIVKANPALETLLGYPAGALAGVPLAELIHADDAPADASQLFSSDSQHEFEKRFVRQDGEALCCRMVVSRIHGAGDPRSVHLIEDISERKEVVKRLVQAEKMEVVGRLAAGFAHDFNNFVTVINGFSQLLLRRAAGDDPTRFELQQIRTAGDRAAVLVQRMLVFSRQQVSRATVLDLNSLIGGLDHTLRSLVGEKVRLTLKLGSEPTFVRQDQIQVEQILMNLANNGRDAMPDGGELTISTENVQLDEAAAGACGLAPAEYVALTVSDTGHGMDEATRTHIFEPFFTTKEIGKGTGLGLWMVREAVTQSQGGIDVESELGQGTSFRIRLPRVTGVECSAENLSRQVSPSELAEQEYRESAALLQTGTAPEAVGNKKVDETPKFNIVVLDDDPAIRALLRHVLQPAYRVLEASTGRQALDYLRRRTVNLLITDLIMPDQEGLETIQKVRKEFPDLKVVAMSGGFGEQFLGVAKKLGATEVLHKPFKAETVKDVVRRLLHDNDAEAAPAEENVRSCANS